MSSLLLVSSSRVHPTGPFEHCLDAIDRHFDAIDRLLFIPYALADQDRYLELVSQALAPVGIAVESIHRTPDPQAAVHSADGIFVGGGNSFRLLRTLYHLDLLPAIRQAVQQRGVPYMGSSAGTNLACPTIRTTNDMPIVEPPSLNALGLIPFQINPHFLDADPQSTHRGETREQRLAEYLEENETPVVGLREGSWLEVAENRCWLRGTTGMKLFRREQAAEEVTAEDVSFLLPSPANGSE